MASRRQQKNLCIICGKMVGVFSCRGCAENFCLRHTNDHRDLLQKSMNEILYNYDLFQRNIQRQTTEQYQYLLMKQIDQWEQQSIDKIRQLADNTRQELVTIIQDHNNNLKENLEELKQQIDIACQDGGFYENDLKEWTERLNELQKIFIEQQIIKFDEDINSIPFISKISINPISNKSVRNDQKIIENLYEDYSNRKEKDEYSSGKHLIKFKIEQYGSHSSILFGITSKIASNISNPYKNPTFYGWTEKNLVYLAGVPERNFNGYKSDFQNNDIYLLTIDCNQEMINLKNERTNHSFDLDIDLRKCPFPWQLNVHLFNDAE